MLGWDTVPEKFCDEGNYSMITLLDCDKVESRYNSIGFVVVGI